MLEELDAGGATRQIEFHRMLEELLAGGGTRHVEAAIRGTLLSN
jgi:hypothetical protein